MATQPILFSAPMVRALLAGRKTMTRRALKPQPVRNEAGLWTLDLGRRGFSQTDDVPATMRERGWLRFAPGDLLWVRETIARIPASAYRCSEGVQQTINPTDPYVAAIYRASFDRSGDPGWRPSIHMPRWASRLTLAVTAVKVERLQDISEADAIAEGINRDETLPENVHRCWLDLGHNTEGADWLTSWDARDVFRQLWWHINGPGAWEANPWVVALKFTVHRANVDTLLTEAD